MNGLYDVLCVLFIFPIIVAIGAGSQRVDGLSIRIAKFFGDLSFPLYITHYPLIYIYTGWIAREKPSLLLSTQMGILLFCAAITMAYACLKLYDEPTRRWLSRKVLGRAA